MFPQWVTSPEKGRFSGRIATLASRQAPFGMTFPPLLMKQLQRCDLVVTALFVGTVYTTRM